MVYKILSIIRWPNLIMLAGIQSLIYFRLLDSQLTTLTLPVFFGLSLITILLAAGGYVINDFYDWEIDRINKPNRMVAKDLLTLNKVKLIYFFLIGIGALLSISIALELDLIKYVFIYPLSVAGLWLYSYKLKCTPVIGNLWVSLFCAGVVFIIILPDLILKHLVFIRVEIWYYISFAFLSTWYREVVKDIEDESGDSAIGCRTFVVRFGVRAGKIMALILSILLLAALFFWEITQENLLTRIALIIILLLTLLSLAFVLKAQVPLQYHRASNVIKLVMAIGTIILLLPK
ncbi:MAG: UbiA family prenyltransferase [Saprospiraceae bacterium]